MRRQGKRTDLDSTSDTERRKLETSAIVGEQIGMGQTQVKKYVRLTELIPVLLDLVDEKKIKSAGVSGVIRPSKTAVQVVVGVQVQHVADELKKMM